MQPIAISSITSHTLANFITQKGAMLTLERQEKSLTHSESFIKVANDKTGNTEERFAYKLIINTLFKAE